MDISLNGILGISRLFSHISMQFDVVQQESTGIIYHYTSPSNITGILTNQENRKAVVLFASRYDCLNDESEGTIADKVYSETVELLHELGDITDTMYTYCRMAKRIKSKPQYKFVTSFSRNPDSLAMWKYYSKGNGYEGINIGLRVEELWNSFTQSDIEDDCISIIPVIYEPEEQKCIIEFAIKRLQRVFANELEFGFPLKKVEVVHYLSELLYDWKLMFKSEHFQHEEEVRIIIDVPYSRKGKKSDIPIEYRYSNGYWIPYIKLHIQPEALERITMGPARINTNQKKKQIEIVRDMIASKGFKANTVEYSHIPLRY